jgi:YidC/Oxa1 family membrane protein insertase
VSEFAQKHIETAQSVQPAVTTATPELAPAGIDKAAVVDGASLPAETATNSASTATDPKTLDELFVLDPVKDAPLPKAEFDPTALVDHAGQLKEMGLDYGFGMTTGIERLLETIYLQTGWGWAGSIIAASLIIRSGTFVLQAISSDKMAAMSALKPVTQPIQEKLDAAIARGDKQSEQLYRLQQAEVLKPYVGGMAATGGFMVAQGYIGFCAFRILRAMGDLPVPGMTSDGFLWFKDLTVPDPYYILPAATSAIMYIVFKARCSSINPF